MSVRPRPVSPHLTVYRFTITMTMSIVHRITGSALYAGSALLAIWLVAVAVGGEAFEAVDAIYSSWFGMLVMFGYTWALVHHALGGLRHFTWDLIIGLERGRREALAWLNLFASIGITILIWIAFAVAG